MIIPSSSQAFLPPQPNPDREVNQTALNQQFEVDNITQETAQSGSATAQQKKTEQEKTEQQNAEQQSSEQESQVQELRKIDREVRAHEQAHLAAAGGLSKGGANFEFTTGPDGQRYAVSGEVQIDTSGVAGDPEATAQKAQQIQQAALAPAQPSSQDRSVAVAAAAMAAEARAEIASQGLGDNESNVDNDNNEEEGFQRVVSKINDTYNAITDTDSQRASFLVDLIA